MAKVLVTGGKGVLGRRLVPRLLAAGHDVTVTSRTPQERDDGATEVMLDLAGGLGVEAAVADQDVIIHAASDAKHPVKVDERGTTLLVAAAEDAGVGHFIYISIVGVDAHPLRYYRTKYLAELAIQASRLRYSIVRATQFHDLVGRFVDEQRRLPAVFIPNGVRFQVIETAVVAEALARLVDSGPSGRLPDMGGPEQIPLIDLARGYLHAIGSKKRVFGFRMFGRSGGAFRAGANLTPNVAAESSTWNDHLAELEATRAAGFVL